MDEIERAQLNVPQLSGPSQCFHKLSVNLRLQKHSSFGACLDHRDQEPKLVHPFRWVRTFSGVIVDVGRFTILSIMFDGI